MPITVASAQECAKALHPGSDSAFLIVTADAEAVLYQGDSKHRYVTIPKGATLPVEGILYRSYEQDGFAMRSDIAIVRSTKRPDLTYQVVYRHYEGDEPWEYGFIQD